MRFRQVWEAGRAIRLGLRSLGQTLLVAVLVLLLCGAAPAPEDPEEADRAAALILQGMYHEALGEYRAGIALYHRAAEAGSAGRGEALALAGGAALKAGALEEARALLREAGELLPESALVQFYLGRLSEIEGASKRAREHYLRAAELSPLWPDPVVRAGALMNGEGEYLASVPLLLRAMPIASRLPEYHRQLSEAYLGLHSHLSSHPGDPAAREALELAGLERLESPEALLHELLDLAEHALERARQLAP